MARITKKENRFTPEEKMAQALVPDTEQPYSIPRNWCWCKMGAISEFERGITFPSSAKEGTPSESSIACLRTANVQDELDLSDLLFVNKSFIKDNEAKLSRVNDIIMSSANSRELVGKTCFVNNVPLPMTFGGFVLTIRAKKILSKFLFYYLRLSFLAGKFIEEATQTTNIANISTGTLSLNPIPVPPIDEQQRIVDRIESLFVKLDEAKEKAQAVIDSYEDRKAAILHKAFTGKLTEEWRKEQKITLNSWIETTIGECSYLITKGASPRWQGISYTNDRSKTLFVTSENVREGFFDWSKEKYLDNTINDIQKRSVLQRGDVLVNIVGASIGRSAVFNKDCLANTNQAVCLVRVKPLLYNEYLCLYFNSPIAFKYYDEKKVETARANISLTNISDMPIKLPSYAEQQEIVNRLNGIINREVAINEDVKQILDQIDSMKKSILARAFRGELCTNDPNDEPAIESLKKIISEGQENSMVSAKRARTSIPKEISVQLSKETEREIIKLFYKTESGAVSINEIMALNSKKFEIIDTLRGLEKKGIIKKTVSGDYMIVGRE